MSDAQIPEPSPNRVPPDGVRLVARVHWTTSAVISSGLVALHLLLRNSSLLTLTPDTYLYGFGLAGIYGIAGLLVWTGSPGGRLLSYVCSVLYMARPPLGPQVWRIMRSPEYREHFRRRSRPKKPTEGEEQA